MKHWDRLTDDEKNACGEPVKRGPKFGFQHVWFVDGDLATYWDVELRDYLEHLQAAYSDKIYGTKNRNTHVDNKIETEIYLFAENDSIRSAVPTVVLLCEQIKYADRFRKVLYQDSMLTRYGIDCVSRKDDTRAVAGPPVSPWFRNIAGHRIIFTDSAASDYPNFRHGSLGGVLRLGNTGYWGLTTAHAWLAEDDNNRFISAGGLSIYLIENGIRGSEVNQQRITIDDFTAVASSHKYIGGWNSSDAHLPLRFHQTHDWLLFRIYDPRFNNENAIILGDGRRLVARPREKEHWPSAKQVVFSGASSGIAQGSISKASFYRKFPWTRDKICCHAVDCDSKIGDSGAWALDPDTGDICGIVTAYNRESKLTYVVPAEHVFDDILLLWHDIVPSINAMFSSEDVAEGPKPEQLRSVPYLSPRESKPRYAPISQTSPTHGLAVNRTQMPLQGSRSTGSEASHITPSFQDPVFSQRTHSPSSGISHLEPGQESPSAFMIPPREDRLFYLQDTVASSFVSIELRNYKLCQKFLHNLPEILQVDPTKFQAEATRAWAEGKTDLGNRCIERQAFLEGYSKSKEEYFFKLENENKEAEVELLRREEYLRSQVIKNAAEIILSQEQR